MKILISGAGLAGLTIAYWLKHYGFEPTIVERASTLLTGGYKIDVRGAALEVIRRMGIYETVVSLSTHMKAAMLVDKNGKIINEMSGDAFGHRVGDDVEIIRGILCQILKDQLPDLEFIFGDSIQQISQTSAAVKVKFQHHESREFDLVIGADGIHSNVRRLVFGDEKNFLRDLGLYLCVYTVPNYLNIDRVEMQYSELGRVAALWSAQDESNMKACFGFVSPTTVDLHDRARQQQLLKKVYEGINWEVPRLLQMMQDTTDFYFDSAAQIHMDHWYKDRVVLVGDAAYCPSPMSGQGTSVALVGAYVLAGELAQAKGNYQIAFEKYEEVMQPFVKINQELGMTSANLMKSQGKNSIFVGVLNLLMKITPGWLIKFLINLSTKRIKIAANSIVIKDYSSD